MAVGSKQRLVGTFSTEARFVYNTPVHLLLQAKRGWMVFELHGPMRSVQARISVNIWRDQALSPVRAPFGSFEIYSRVTSAALLKFIRFIEAILIQMGVRQLTIKSWPSGYQPVQARQVYNALVKRLHFKVLEEVSSIIPVTNKPLHSRMKISERQKARKAERQFSFTRCGPKEYKSIYDFISTCRQERNQSLSLSWKEIQKTTLSLPDRFLFFKVGNETDIAAAAIVIRVSDKIWYTFYYAHAARYNKVSPVVHLLACIYEAAGIEKIKWIDLGTSMLNDGVNKPLLHFKESVGARTVPKFSFSKMYG